MLPSVYSICPSVCAGCLPCVQFAARRTALPIRTELAALLKRGATQRTAAIFMQRRATGASSRRAQLRVLSTRITTSLHNELYAHLSTHRLQLPIHALGLRSRNASTVHLSSTLPIRLEHIARTLLHIWP